MNRPLLAVLVVSGVLAAGLLIFGGASSYVRQTAAVVTATLLSLTNEKRAGDNLYGLTESAVLTAAAQAKANDMAARGYFSHTGPEGRQFWHWIRDAGYSYQYAGENLAIHFSDSEDVVDAWLNSPSHRSNIYNAKFKEIGIATATGTYKGRTTTFIVQMFGSTVGVSPTPDTTGNASPLATHSQ